MLGEVPTEAEVSRWGGRFVCLCAWGTAGLEVGGLWALPRNAGKLTQLEVSQVGGKDKAGYGPALFALGGKKVWFSAEMRAGTLQSDLCSCPRACHFISSTR